MSHQHVLYENYIKGLNVEAQCLLSMAKTYILPAAFEYKSKVFNWASNDSSGTQMKFLNKLNGLINDLLHSIDETKNALESADKFNEEHLHDKATFFYKELINGNMKRLRSICDDLEKVVDNKMWPLPKYSEMLFFK